jgi:hypothetical protein
MPRLTGNTEIAGQKFPIGQITFVVERIRGKEGVKKRKGGAMSKGRDKRTR